MTEHALAEQVLRDPGTWSSDTIDGPPPPGHDGWLAELVDEEPELRALPLQTLLALDPPLRRVLVPFLSAARIRRLAPVVGAHVAELAPRVLTGRPVDVVAAFAAELPLRTVASLLGLAQGERAAYGALAAAASTSNPHRDTKATLRARPLAELALLRRFGALLAGPASALAPESLLAGLHGAVAEGRLSAREAAGLRREVLVAGAETTVHHLASVVLLVAREPGLLERVRGDAQARRVLVEEALRLESPFTGFWRRATRPVTLGGVDVPADGLLLVPFGALSRDPATFAAPDGVDLDRDAPRQHLALGHGIHACVGAPLARLESEVALDALLPAVERVELLVAPTSCATTRASRAAGSSPCPSGSCRADGRAARPTGDPASATSPRERSAARRRRELARVGVVGQLPR